MKLLRLISGSALLTTLLSTAGLLVAPQALSCDEECRRTKAESTHNVDIPSYLSWKYCGDIKAEFMSVSLRSLETYRDTNMSTQRKRSMKNTRHFVEQRKDWLQECDNYMKMTKNERLFKDDATTDNIFETLTDLSEELSSLLSGVTYASDFGQDSTVIAGEHFDQLFKLVDDHKTLLQLKGQYVYNR